MLLHWLSLNKVLGLMLRLIRRLLQLLLSLHLQALRMHVLLRLNLLGLLLRRQMRLRL